MPKFATLEHTTLRDPQGNPRTVTVRESAVRVLLARGYRRQGGPVDQGPTVGEQPTPPGAGESNTGTADATATDGDQPPEETAQNSAPSTTGRTRVRRSSPPDTAA